jgi:hypothetical protein
LVSAATVNVGVVGNNSSTGQFLSVSGTTVTTGLIKVGFFSGKSFADLQGVINGWTGTTTALEAYDSINNIFTQIGQFEFSGHGRDGVPDAVKYGRSNVSGENGQIVRGEKEREVKVAKQDSGSMWSIQRTCPPAGTGERRRRRKVFMRKQHRSCRD